VVKEFDDVEDFLVGAAGGVADAKLQKTAGVSSNDHLRTGASP